MKLIDEIIELAVDDTASLPVILRKCLVLAHQLKNQQLRVWAQRELDGYSRDDSLPEYRKTDASAKGMFAGPMGSSLKNQPLPPIVLEPKHRSFAEKIELRQPIASYCAAKPSAKQISVLLFNGGGRRSSPVGLWYLREGKLKGLRDKDRHRRTSSQ
jgi:hypothetical protein